MTGISEKAMLANLSIHGLWSGVREDREISQKVATDAGVRSAKKMGRYEKFVIDPANQEFRKWHAEAGALRDYHYERTLPWNDDGTRLLTTAMYLDYTQGVAERKQRIEQAAQEFFNALPSLKEQRRFEANGMFREEDWPDPITLADKLKIRIRIYPIADPNDIRVSLGEQEVKLIEKNAVATFQAKMAECMLDVFRRFKAQLCGTETQRGFIQKLNEYNVGPNGKVSGAFRDSVVTSLRDLVELVPKLNIMEDPTLKQLTEEIRQGLCARDAQDLRDDYMLRKQVVASAQTIATKLGAIEDVLSTLGEAA